MHLQNIFKIHYYPFIHFKIQPQPLYFEFNHPDQNQGFDIRPDYYSKLSIICPVYLIMYVHEIILFYCLLFKIYIFVFIICFFILQILLRMGILVPEIYLDDKIAITLAAKYQISSRY